MSPIDGLPSPQGHWYPVSQVAKQTPYSATFVRQLARQGKIDAVKIGRDWLTTEQSVLQYIQVQQERHKKALAILQTAEKAFLTVALIAIVFSATPKAQAEDLSTRSVRPENTVSATLHNLISGWQDFVYFDAEELAAVFRVNGSSLAEQADQFQTGLLWQKQETCAVLVSLGQALLGKTPEEYLADAPVPVLEVARYSPHSRGLSFRNAVPTSFDLESQQPEVLGLSTTRTPNPPASKGDTAKSGITQTQIQNLIDQTFQRYIVSGAFTGPQGPQGLPGPTGLAAFGFSGPNGMVQNGNGQTTSVIGGTPIVSYYPAVPSQNFTGTSLAGFGSLSAGTLASGNTTISGNLNVSGPISATGAVTVGSLNSSGNAVVDGTLSAGSSTLASLVVSGAATFTGSTTIAGLTVTGFNPGLTLGSVAFEGSSALAQDNGNFFYDSTDHRLGIGTTTPSQLLTVAGNAMFTGQLSVAGPTALGTTTIANLTLAAALPVSSGGTGQTSYTTNGVVYTGVSGLQSTSAGVAYQVLSSNGSGSAPAYSNITSLLTAGSNVSISGTSTIAVSSTPSFTSLTLTNPLTVANGGIGTTALGSLTVGSNLSITGGQSVLIGTSTQITLSSTPTFATVNGLALTSGSGALNLGSNTLTLTGNASVNQNLLTISSPTFNSLTLTNPLPVSSGGTGISTSPANNGQLLLASSTGWTVGSLAAGSNVTISTSTPGQIIIAAAGSGLIGSGTAGYDTLWNNGNTLGTGVILNSSSVAGINATSSSYTFNLQGSLGINPFNVSSSSGTSLLTVLGNGNVGIGTAVPGAGTTISPTTGITTGSRLTVQTPDTYSIMAGANTPLGAPTVTCTAVTSNTGVLTGTYQYAYAEESTGGGGYTNLSPPCSVTANGNTVLITIGMPRRGVVGQQLYRKNPGDSTFRFVHGYGGGYFQNQWYDNTADAVVATGAIAQSTDTSGTANFVADQTVKYFASNPNTCGTGPCDLTLLTGNSGYQGYAFAIDAYSTITARTYFGPSFEALKTGTNGFLFEGIWGDVVDGVDGSDVFTVGPQGSLTIALPTAVTIPAIAVKSGGTGGTSVFSVASQGSLQLTAGVLNDIGSGAANTQYAANINATLPTVTTNPATGVNIVITGAGNSAQTQTALSVDLIAGYTGLSTNYAIRGLNNSASSGTSIGVLGQSVGIATTSIGVAALVSGSATHSMGLFASPAGVDPSSALSWTTGSLSGQGIGGTAIAATTGSNTDALLTLFNNLTPTYTITHDGSQYIAKSGASTLTASWSGGVTANLVLTSSTATFGTTNNGPLIIQTNGNTVATFSTSGNVGIGTTSPQYLLQVGSASVASGTVARFQNINGTCDINPTTNTLACSSDEHLKKNITPMTDNLSQVMALQPVYFNWNAENAGTAEHPGFVAQQVQQIMPEVVSTDPTTGLLSIGYSDLVPVMVGAMQQMQAEITTLQGGLTGNATTSNLTVYSPFNFSGDSVGEAEILAGSTSAKVNFSQPYEYQPIVVATPMDFVNGAYRVTLVDSTGFTVEVQQAQPRNIMFNWHAFASPAAQLTVSNGTTRAITLVVAIRPPADPSDAGQGSVAPAAGNPGVSSSLSSGQVLGDATTSPDSSTSTRPGFSGSSTPDSKASASSSPPLTDQLSGAQVRVAGTPTSPSDSGTSPTTSAALMPPTQPSTDPSTSSMAADNNSSETASPPSDASSAAGGSATPPPESTSATPTVDSSAGSTSQ
jgi:hypothetical protein